MDGTSEHVLDNGLKVIIVEAHGTPTACCSVWYRAGSKNESAGTTGLAHLLEHMMFKGTERFPKGEFDRILHKNGAINNASTWLDRTNYYELVSANRLELILELEADRMRGALFNQTDLEDEMPVVRNELERDEDDPYSNIFERIQSTAFLEHPYHWPTIGWKSDVEAIRADQIREFYDRHYHPNNAFLVIVGDVETTQTLKLVAKHFDAIPPGPDPVRPVTVEPPQKGERRVVIRKPGENDILGMAYRIPPRLHPDNYALDLLGQILGQGRTSRMYAGLVETKLAVRASAVNYSTLEDPFLFFVDAEVSPGGDPTVVEEAIHETVETLRTSPVTKAELERAKKRNRVDFVYRKDRTSSQAFFLGELEICCGWRFASGYLDEMQKVTPVDIQRVAERYLVADSRTVGLYRAERLHAAGEADTAATVPQRVTAAAAETGAREPAATSRTAGEVKTHRAVLGNGIVALARPNRANQTVEVTGRIEGGMMLEDGPGVTYAMTRLMDRGTKQRTRIEISEILEGLGASVSMRCSIEAAGFHAKCLRGDLPTVLNLLVEILLEPTFPEAEWEIVRRQIQNSIRDSRQDTFDRAYYKALSLVCGEKSVYSRPAHGTEESLESIDPPRLAALHGSVVAGKRMSVAIVGDVSAEEGLSIIDEHFGSVAAGDTYPTKLRAEEQSSLQALAAPVYEHVELPEKSQVDIVFARPGLTRLDPAYDAASVANYILGGHFSSRLNKQLRDNEGLTYGTHSRLRPGLGFVPWYASIGVHPRNFEKARDGVLREMRRLAEQGIDDAEFEDAIQHLTGSFPVRLETNGALANILLDGERYGLGPDVIEGYVPRVEALTKSEVEAQAKRLFDVETIAIASAGTLKTTS